MSPLPKISSAPRPRSRITLPLWICTAAAALLSGVAAHAQTGGEDQPAMAMGAGRMIRGTVTAVAADRLTLKTDAGDLYSVALTPNTQVRHGRDPLKAAEIHPGDSVGAMGELDRPNKTVHALFVQLVTAEEAKKMRDALGRTWIAGTITAIDEVKLTVMRPDKVSQTIQVDEDTSFKRGGRNIQAFVQGNGEASGGFGGGPGGGGRRSGGPATAAAPESITLADVKVGDTIAGQGALKNGIFTPKELMVGDPAAARRRRAEAATAGAPK